MVLVDTSIWIDHLRKADPALVSLLDESRVCLHPMVVAELALGTFRNRIQVLDSLSRMPTVASATHDEVLQLIENHHLHGKGLGVVDVHLLAATLLTPGTSLWTRDKRLQAAAAQRGVAAR